MEKQNRWKYNKKCTIEHELACRYRESIEKIGDVINEEGEKNTQFTNQICLNIDKVEKLLAKKEKRNANKTMDTTFAISSGKKHEMLLCEYRLNYKKPENISKKDLNDKISYSKSLLGNQPAVHNVYIFVFNTKIKAQALNKIRRIFSNKNTVSVVDIQELKKIYFD